MIYARLQIMKMLRERFLTSVRNDNHDPRLSFRPKGEILLYLYFRGVWKWKVFTRLVVNEKPGKDFSLRSK